jgi:hypothetical protein
VGVFLGAGESQSLYRGLAGPIWTADAVVDQGEDGGRKSNP